MFCKFLIFGALTAKPYAFVSRSWELDKFTTFDFTTGDLPPIHFFYRGVEIIRVLPFGSLDESEWIPNRARFFFEGFKLQRLMFPFLRLFSTRMHYRVNWVTSFFFFLVYANESFLPNSFFTKFGFRSNLVGSSVGIDFVNGFTSFDQLSYVKLFLARFGLGRFYSNAGCLPMLDSFLYAWRPFYVPSRSLASIVNLYASTSDGQPNNLDFFFFFFNPRLESPLLNARFRALSNGLSNILTFGVSSGFLNYKTYNLGVSFLQLSLFLQGRHSFCRYFSSYSFSNIAVVYSLPLFATYASLNSGSKLLFLFQRLVSIFQTYLKRKTIEFFPHFQHSSFITEMEIGCFKMNWVRSTPSSILYIYENNEVDVGEDCFNLVVYQGFQAEYSMCFADLVFPALAYFEDSFSGWRNDGRFTSFDHLVRNADTNALSSFLIFEKLNKFVTQQRITRLNRSHSISVYNGVVNLSKNRFIIRLINRYIYRFFLSYSELLGISGFSSKLVPFLRYLEALRPGILTDMSLPILQRLWAMEVRYSSRSPHGRLPNIPIVPVVEVHQVKTIKHWYRFFLILEKFIFKNMAFLVDTYCQRPILNHQPRFFYFFGGGFNFSFVRECFDVLSYICLTDVILQEFVFFSFFNCYRRLKQQCIQRKIINRVFLSTFFSVIKKFYIRRIFRSCANSIKNFQKFGIKHLQARFFTIGGGGASFYGFSYFSSCVAIVNGFIRYGVFSLKIRVSLTQSELIYPNFLIFLDSHYSSAVRLSRSLFLESRYFFFSLFNFSVF